MGYLHRLCNGNQQHMAEFIDLYLAKEPGLFAELGRLGNAGDCAQLARSAHGLRPLAVYFGAMELDAKLGRVQREASTEEVLPHVAHVQDCLELHQAVMGALEQWKASVAGTQNT